jgi:iron complex outermembrane recepter protein
MHTRSHARASAAPMAYLSSSCAPFVLAACVSSAWPAVAFAQAAAPLVAATTSDVIVVTASPVAGPPDRFATIVTQISRDDIVQAGGANLADALRDVPGVANTSFAAGASRPVIRGMDAFRVKVLEDGISSSDVSEVGPDHGVPIDPLSARSIEVVRGAATLRWGSQAIGGVVNAINNRVPLTLPAAPLSGEATGSYDSNAASGQGSLLLDARAGQFAIHADGFARRASDYGTADGEQTNSFFHGDGYSVGSSYFFGSNNQSHTGLGYIHYDARYGIPSDTTYIDMRQDKYLSNTSFHVSDGVLQTLNVNLGYANYIHDEIDPDTGEIASTFKNREWNGRAEALFGAMGPFSNAAVGVDYSGRHFAAGGEGGDYLSPTYTRSGALFAFTESHPGDGVQVQAAARVERNLVDGTPGSGIATSRDYTPVSGSVGALFDVAPYTKFGLTLSSAGRAPGQVELFAHGPHDGPGTFETGDPDLKIERANSFEATLRYRPDRLDFEGALWDARFSNYIFGDLTGNLCDSDGDCTSPPDADLKELNYEQRDANFWGAEAHAVYDLARMPAGTVQAVGLADYVRAKFSDNGGDVPRIQPYRIGGGLNWTSGAFDAGFLALFVGAQKHVPAGESTTDSYWNLDAQTAWRPLGADGGFEVALVGHNLTDEVQRNAVSLNRDVVELPGRDVRIVLRQSF